MVSGSGCCASHLHGTSSGWSLQNNCRFPWSVHWCASCGVGVAGATGAVAGVAGAGLTGNIPGEDSGVGATSVLTGMSGLTASG